MRLFPCNSNGMCPMNTCIMQHIWKCYNSGGLSSREPHTSLLPQLFLYVYVQLVNDLQVTSTYLQLESLKPSDTSKEEETGCSWLVAHLHNFPYSSCPVSILNGSVLFKRNKIYSWKVVCICLSLALSEIARNNNVSCCFRPRSIIFNIIKIIAQSLIRGLNIVWL